jgi:hypothetical protein
MQQQKKLAAEGWNSVLRRKAEVKLDLFTLAGKQKISIPLTILL